MLKVKLISLENNSNLHINVTNKSESYGPSQNGISTNMRGSMTPFNYEYQNTKGDIAPYYQSGYNGASGYNYEGGNRQISAYNNYDGECKGYNPYAYGGDKGVSANQKTYQSAPDTNCKGGSPVHAMCEGYYDAYGDYYPGVDHNLGGNNYYDYSDDYYAAYPYQPSNEKESCSWFW
ncbi:uncharacterized protein LOC111048893 [Nilaparvata lugens]|uniref:uncharacterized protein LOC111048893 n=1 Tax=Nilaparvata lugens TaxID=108931 RepID=UPI00193DED49|nr:uncharacterized protein LOC111048893 [Nilaparvata lugens]